MIIELTNKEASEIIIKSIAENQRVHMSGKFTLNWKIAAATGQPAILVGATISIEPSDGN